MTGSVTAEEGLPKTIEFEVSVAEIQSERGAAMDKKMHAALKKEEHPKISFNLIEVKNSTNLAGKLNVAGQEKAVEIPVKMDTDNGSLKISGEYAMIRLADEAGALDYESAMMESLMAFKRAGADMILSYAACDVADWLK